MATKRRPLHSHSPASSSSAAGNSFRSSGAGGNNTGGDAHYQQQQKPSVETRGTGTRPTTAPATVKEVIMMMIMHVCKKTIFYNINLKVALYLGSLFLVSLIGDFAPYPKTYFARSDNLFNVYFVKMGWAWTLVFSAPFMFMTSYTLCCGNAQRMFKHHLSRIIIATAFWFCWTKMFNIIESTFGRCNNRHYDSKSLCLKAGHFWNGFDISGHAFILIYSSLVLIEETRPIIGWEYIKEHIRNEEHNRAAKEKSLTNPLRNLKDSDIRVLKYLYEKYTPIIRLMFIGATVLQLLWDIMLVCTMLYYHKMIEKVISGIIAILTWFFCYRVWYPSITLLPDVAGHGLFNYQKKNAKIASMPIRRSSITRSSMGDMPRFMGMPLYGLNAAQQQQQQSRSAAGSGDSASVQFSYSAQGDLSGGGGTYRFQD